jgi:hypothetical protein
MTRATIPQRRKHIYVYTLLLLATAALAMVKPVLSTKAPEKSRAAEVNKLSDTLFQ